MKRVQLRTNKNHYFIKFELNIKLSIEKKINRRKTTRTSQEPSNYISWLNVVIVAVV